MKAHKPLTPFQWSVLKATLEIPLGETRTYQWVARRIGKPGSVRAVGTALRNNPYPLIIPCHRVIRADGTLGKYAGKDDGRKAKLLETERLITDQMKKVKSARRSAAVKPAGRSAR